MKIKESTEGFFIFYFRPNLYFSFEIVSYLLMNKLMFLKITFFLFLKVIFTFFIVFVVLKPQIACTLIFSGRLPIS